HRNMDGGHGAASLRMDSPSRRAAPLPTLRRLSKLLGALQAADHRRREQIRPRLLRRSGDLDQAVAKFGAGAFQVLLVLDRLFLDIFLGDEAALLLEGVELAVALRALPHRGEALGQVDGIMDAAVHSHAAERIVDVRGIADEKRAALAKARGDALMHAIE